MQEANHQDTKIEIKKEILIKKVRKHGFQPPFSKHQVATIAFFVQVIWLAVIILNHFAWGLYGYKATINDPTDPFVLEGIKHKGKGMLWCVVCKGYVQEQSKHCSQCNRCTEVFDHHCVWLNNCIGRRNYSYFIKFTVSCFIIEAQWIVLNITYVLTQNSDYSYENFVFIADKQNKQGKKSSIYKEEQKQQNTAQNKQETSNIDKTDQKMVQSIPTQNYETKGFTMNTLENKTEIQKVSVSKKFVKLKSIQDEAKNDWENKFMEKNQIKKNNQNVQIEQNEFSKIENTKFDDNNLKLNSDLNEIPNLSIYGVDQSQVKLQQNKSPNKKQLPSFGNLDNFQKSSENIDQQMQYHELHSKRIFQVKEEKEPDNISTSVVQSQIDEKNEDQYQSSWFQNSNSLTASSIQNYQLQKIIEKNNLQFLPIKKQKRHNQKLQISSSEQSQSSKIVSEKRITFGIFKQGDQYFDQEQENNPNFINEGGQNELSFNLNDNINEQNL
ncbi:hypothetical protein ABPG74_014685 [Tetrahymena malaccensis]